MYNTKVNKKLNTIFTIFFILFIFFLCLADLVTKKTVYSTDSYWVAKDYHHVYDKYSGEIVDIISENEKCVIKGNDIVVINRNLPIYTLSIVMAVFSGLTVGTIIVSELLEWHDEKYARIDE